MNARKALRFAIVVLWLSVAIGLLISYPLESDLPSHLQQYITWDMEQDLSQWQFALMIFGLLLVVAIFVGSIGLFVFRAWARNLFVISWGALLLISPFLGPTVSHCFVSFFSHLGTLSAGIILGIVFFTDAIKPNPRVA